MSLPQLFPRIKTFVGAVASPLHGHELQLAQTDNGFVIVDSDPDHLSGSYLLITSDLLTRLSEEMKSLKSISHNDRNLLQKAKGWSSSLAKLSDSRLEQLLYGGLLILARQRKLLIRSKDQRILFRRLNLAAAVEVNGVANIFDSGGLTIARLSVANFDRLVAAALTRGYVSSDLVREVLPSESRLRKDLPFALARWLQVYLDLEIRG